MNNNKFTYQKSGVNITTADKFVEFISKNTKQKKINQNIKILVILAQLLTFQKIIKIQKLYQVQMA